MRRMTGFLTSGVLVVALAAPAWGADTGPAAGGRSGGEGAGGPAMAAAATVPGHYEANRHGSDHDRYDGDGRWYYRDGRWYYYRDGRWYHYRDGHRYHDGGRYHRDGYYGDGYYRDGYYRDGRYRYGHPYHGGGRTPHCPGGEWAYHPNTGWMCVG